MFLLNKLAMSPDFSGSHKHFPEPASLGAQAEGLSVTADMYNYEAGGTGLSSVIPPWYHDGGEEALRDLRAPDAMAADGTTSPNHWATVQRLLQAGDDAFWNLAFPDAYATEADASAPHSRYTRRVALGAAPAGLAPRNHLALRPWDAVDMLRHYLRRIVPRGVQDAGALDSRSAEVAQAQAGLFRDTQPVIDGITKHLGASAQAAIAQLYEQVGAILQRPDDKRDLDAALHDLLAAASASLRRSDPGATLFIPPSRVANPEPGDWLRFEEIGQWVHKDFVRERA